MPGTALTLRPRRVKLGGRLLAALVLGVALAATAATAASGQPAPQPTASRCFGPLGAIAAGRPGKLMAAGKTCVTIGAHGGVVDPSFFDMAAGPHGTVWLTEAGGTIVRVSRTGQM